MRFLAPHVKNRALSTVLDIGAGEGALSKRLHEAGMQVNACDLSDTNWQCNDIPFKKVDVNGNLPYDDASFDVAVAVEVVEHITSVAALMAECARVVRPGGIIAMTTPNVVSLKSRMRFLSTGFFYSFKPYDAADQTGMQHINPMTPANYQYLAECAGCKLIDIGTDKYQSSSIALGVLYPFLKVMAKMQRVDQRIHNTPTLLFGRKIFMLFERNSVK